MEDSLINQLCSAIQAWVEETKQHEMDILAFAMVDIGAVWFVKREGGVENPDDPIHRGKTVGEIRGHYTLNQLRDYLHHLAHNLKITEHVLIAGLVKSTETHLLHLTVGFNEKRRDNLENAEFLERVANNPEEFQEFIERFKQRLETKEDEPVSTEQVVEDLREMAAFFVRIGDNPDENEAERKYRVEVWQRLTAPILEYTNLQAAISRYLNRQMGKNEQ